MSSPQEVKKRADLGLTISKGNGMGINNQPWDKPLSKEGLLSQETFSEQHDVRKTALTLKQCEDLAFETLKLIGFAL